MPKQLPRTLREIDRGVLEACIELVPDLNVVVFACALARQGGVRYPLESHEDLKTAFGKKTQLTFMQHTISWEQVLKYFRSEYFPLDSERAFLGCVQLALSAQAREAAAQRLSEWQRPRGTRPRRRSGDAQ